MPFKEDLENNPFNFFVFDIDIKCKHCGQITNIPLRKEAETPENADNRKLFSARFQLYPIDQERLKRGGLVYAGYFDPCPAPEEGK